MRSFSRGLRAIGILLLVFTLTAGAVALVAAPARADPTGVPWGPVVGVNTDVLMESLPTVTFGNGSVYFAELQTIQTWGTTNLTVQRCIQVPSIFAPISCTTSVRANDLSGINGPVDVNYRPSMAVDQNGYVYVAWVKAPGYTGPNGRDVYVSVSTNGGLSFTQPATRVNAPADYGADVSPSIAVAPNGDIWVAYVQAWGSSGQQITLAVSSDHGGSFSGYFNVTNQGGGRIKSIPSLVIGGTGRLQLGYDEYDSVTGRYAANYTSSEDGQTWTAPMTLNAAGWAMGPVLALEGSSTIHALWWNSFQTGAQWSIQYGESHNGGATWSAPMTVNAGNTAPPNVFDVPSVAAVDGTVMAVWNAVQNGDSGFGWSLSTTDGATWAQGPFVTYASGLTQIALAADQNGTFYTANTYLYSSTDHDTYSLLWIGPASAPTGVAATPGSIGSGQVTVSWHAPPQQNVVQYNVWRSTDGSSYSYVATVSAGTTSYVDGPLANGTYWYEITAVNNNGVSSSPSAAASATLGVTAAALQNQIANLQRQLAALQGNASATQAQITQLQNQIKQLQDQLNALQGQQATQTISYANLAFEIIVVVLLVVLLLNQMRRPKSPQLMMAQPAQAAPPKPEDEL